MRERRGEERRGEREGEELGEGGREGLRYFHLSCMSVDEGVTSSRTRHLNELRKELQVIEQEQTKMEARGVELEKRLRGGAEDMGMQTWDVKNAPVKWLSSLQIWKITQQ